MGSRARDGTERVEEGEESGRGRGRAVDRRKREGRRMRAEAARIVKEGMRVWLLRRREK